MLVSPGEPAHNFVDRWSCAKISSNLNKPKEKNECSTFLIFFSCLNWLLSGVSDLGAPAGTSIHTGAEKQIALSPRRLHARSAFSSRRVHSHRRNGSRNPPLHGPWKKRQTRTMPASRSSCEATCSLCLCAFLRDPKRPKRKASLFQADWPHHERPRARADRPRPNREIYLNYRFLRLISASVFALFFVFGRASG